MIHRFSSFWKIQHFWLVTMRLNGYRSKVGIINVMWNSNCIPLKIVFKIHRPVGTFGWRSKLLSIVNPDVVLVPISIV